MQQKAIENPKISFVWDSMVDEVLDVAQDKVTAVKVKNLKTGAVATIDCDGLFLAIGHKPNTKLFEGQLELDVKGYLVTQNKSTRTNIPGVFACGDVQDIVYRQAVTAAGTGCMAAIDAERFLSHQG